MSQKTLSLTILALVDLVAFIAVIVFTDEGWLYAFILTAGFSVLVVRHERRNGWL